MRAECVNDEEKIGRRERDREKCRGEGSWGGACERRRSDGQRSKTFSRGVSASLYHCAGANRSTSISFPDRAHASTKWVVDTFYGLEAEAATSELPGNSERMDEKPEAEISSSGPWKL